MVLTRTGKGEDSGTMANQQMLEELKEQVARLSAAVKASSNENEVLRNQLTELRDVNRRLHEKSKDAGGKSSQSTESQTETTSNPPDATNEIDRNKNSEKGNSEINLELVNGILSKFETLNINVILPTYDGDNGNPMRFLEKLEKYFARKKIPEDQKLLVLEDALKGRAHVWYEARYNPFISFRHFKHAFLTEFYSLESRIKFKSEWSCRKFKAANRSLREYFNEQVRDAKYITPRLDDYEVYFTIIKQLPQRARDTLATVEYTDADRISQALGRLDASHNENWGNNLYNRSAQQDSQKPAPVNQIHRNNSFNRHRSYNFPQNQEDQDNRSRENWREPGRANQNKNIELPDLSRPPPNVNNATAAYNNNSNSRDSSNAFARQENFRSAYNLHALQRSEFIADLCWDVEGEHGEDESESDARIVSPRVQAYFALRKVSVLIDSGSDITYVSQHFYETVLKENGRGPELN